MAINASLAQQLFSLTHKSAILDGAIFFFAKYLPYFLVLGFIVLLLAERGRRRRAFLFLEALLAVLLSRGIVTEGIRFFHHAPRPFEVWQATPLVPETLGNSFPSGHAAILFALAMALFFSNKKWGAWFFAFAFLNGLARVVAGAHWPFDVAAGALIGIACAYAIHFFLKKPFGALHPQSAAEVPSASAPEA